MKKVLIFVSMIKGYTVKNSSIGISTL